MNPLSPFTYFRRHKRSSLLLVCLVALATVSIYVMVSVLDSIPMRSQVSYLTRVSRVYPAAGTSLEPGIIAQVETHPGVGRVIKDNGLHLSPPSILGYDHVRLAGVSPDEAVELMAYLGVRLKEGRLFTPRTNEIVLSEELARALGLQLGDKIERSDNDIYYGAVPSPLVLVGILENDPAAGQPVSARMGFVSYDYLAGHELFAPRQDSLLVLAQAGQKQAVDEFLETAVASERTGVETFQAVARSAALARQGLYLIFGVVNCLVAVVIALVVGVVNRLALEQRLPELGLLNALGYQKNRLIGRLTLEPAVAAGAGWAAGLGLSLLILAGLKNGLYYARGAELDLANPIPALFSLPTPLVVVAFTAISAARIFAQLDAIAIIEQGKLNTKTADRQRPARRPTSSLQPAKPLSPLTYYQRHRRRAAMLVTSTALMILGVACPVFLVLVPINSFEPFFGHLQYLSEVSSSLGGAVDPAVAGQIRSHPAVADVIPVMTSWMSAVVPPGGISPMSIYAVSENDLPGLMAQLDVQLVAGRLPRPRANEIVISKVMALNSGLSIGDTLRPPVYGQDNSADSLVENGFPVEMVVTGLLSRDDLWVGFASLEYMQSHELTAGGPAALLVIPRQGSKAELDSWLQGQVASSQTRVTVYQVELSRHQQTIQTMILLFVAVESLIAIVAAIALAALNYVFFAQRQDEFGILYAVGRSRRWLVMRTVKETASVVGIAWLIGAVVTVTGLFIAQVAIYTPIGLSLDLLNPTPWLFTLPIPLAVIAVSAGTIGRTLSRLDPLAVIERR